MKLDAVRERYLQDSVPVRLGNLASSLARVASCAGRDAQRERVPSLLDECKRFIEWTGPQAEPEIQPELVRLQVELAQWRLRWPRVQHEAAARMELAERMRARSRQALEWSGLLNG